MALVLGIDSSTQSTKVEIRDADDGRLLASGRAPHPSTEPPRSEHEPSWWWDALVAATGQCAALVPLSEVAAVAVAGQQHGMVLLDRDGTTVRPAKLWNDTESAPQAAALVERFGAAAWAEAVGSVPVASFTITKLAWMAEHEPRHLAAAATVLLPHDWLTWRLCGAFVTDRGEASGTGYFSPGTGAWRPDLLESVTGRSWVDALPRVLGPTEVAGRLRAEAAAALGLPTGIPVGPGTGDNMAAALGMHLAPGTVALSVGTSGTIYTVATAASADPTGRVAGFADATGRYLPLVCTLNATQVTDAVGAWLGLDHAALDTAALAAPPGAGGVTLVPYFNGERTPNRPAATGSLTGLRVGTSPGAIARAAFEGVVCGLLEGRDALHDAGAALDDRRVLLVGGGAHSRAYRQIVADLAQAQVALPAGDEHVALGACLQAAAVLRQTPPEQIAASWQLDATVVAEPTIEATTAAEVRAAYAVARG